MLRCIAVRCDVSLGFSLQVKHSCVHLRWTSTLPHGGVWWEEQSHQSTIPSILRWLGSDQRWALKRESSATLTRRLCPGTHLYTPCNPAFTWGYHWCGSCLCLCTVQLFWMWSYILAKMLLCLLDFINISQTYRHVVCVSLKVCLGWCPNNLHYVFQI